jgi:hypothetical protein
MPRPNPFEGIVNSVEYRVTRRALQRRFVPKKPNMRERLALDNAARTWVRAQWASTDSSLSPDELCKVNAAARRAHALLVDIASEGKQRPRPLDRNAPLPTGFIAA